jgi:uncharacterized protein (TIGR03435 family)
MLVSGLTALTIEATPQRATESKKFEAASIRPCKAATSPGRGGDIRVSPGRLSVICEPLASLIPRAYLTSAERRVPDEHFIRILWQPLRGAPSWVSRDLYQIEAKSEGAKSDEALTGPLLRALLEDRFKLKVHRETKDVPVYALSVARGGPRLEPAKTGSCVTVDRDHPFSPSQRGQPDPRVCGMVQMTANGLDTYGQTIAGLCLQLTGRLDRGVEDRTGLSGMFDMHLEAPRAFLFPGVPLTDNADGQQNAASRPDPAEVFASLQVAVQKLGLKLDRSTGKNEYFVVDHVERPSEN